MSWKWQDGLAVCPGKLQNWWKYWPLNDKKEGNMHQHFHHSCYNFLYQSNRQGISSCFTFRKSCLRRDIYVDLGWDNEALRQAAPPLLFSFSLTYHIYLLWMLLWGLKAFLEMKMMLEVGTLTQSMIVLFLSFVSGTIGILVLLLFFISFIYNCGP